MSYYNKNNHENNYPYENSFANMTLSQLAQEKLNLLQARSTYGSYVEIKKIWDTNIRPYIVDKDISEYNLQDIDDIVNDLKYVGKSNKTINRAMEKLNMFFNHAVDRDYIKKNPMSKFKWLPTNYEEMKILTWEEFEKAVKFEKNYAFRCFFNLMFWTGIRIGEAIVLTWEDFNLVPGDGKVRIEKHLGKDGKIMPARKNVAKGYRSRVVTKYTIGIDDELVTLLLDLKRIAALSYDFEESDYILGGKKIMSVETVRGHFNRDLKRAGLKHIRIHDLRHSAVAFLLNNTNLSIYQVAGRIGDTPRVVLRNYAHFYHNNDEKVTNAINAAKSARKGQRNYE